MMRKFVHMITELVSDPDITESKMAVSLPFPKGQDAAQPLFLVALSAGERSDKVVLSCRWFCSVSY